MATNCMYIAIANEHVTGWHTPPCTHPSAEVSSQRHRLCMNITSAQCTRTCSATLYSDCLAQHRRPVTAARIIAQTRPEYQRLSLATSACLPKSCFESLETREASDRVTPTHGSSFCLHRYGDQLHVHRHRQHVTGWHAPVYTQRISMHASIG
jgi:hypothetical protein